MIARGAHYRVIQSRSFTDCEALDLADEHSVATRTLLLPFDRPRAPAKPRVRMVPRRHWARVSGSVLRATYPYGGLQFCPDSIRLLPYQLEPALAAFRHGVLRMLIADDVGLGKTVEAGMIVREIARRDRLSRTLILTPASVRAQWAQELAVLFDLDLIQADSLWLRRSSACLPRDINPWSLPGVFLASTDFVKRPEALRPLEDVRWDLVVVDEAHAAAPGSDRRAAIHALACRARRVILLTATPHTGNDEDFRALCDIGAIRGSEPMVCFRRTRADTPLERTRHRSTMLAVRLTDHERLTHRLLDAYTSRIWNESKARNDSRGELLATILRKRALSSPVSLLVSVRRRLELLAGAAPVPSQQTLPWEDGDAGEADDLVSDPGLAAEILDAEDERRMLTILAESAETAAAAERKTRVILRLLRRIHEPAIIFTEYRDTAEHLQRTIREAGHRVSLLHGGLPHKARLALVAEFTAGRSILVATDAASEGLNLHHACRLVLHFELPWTPLRLHQRCGRVNRIGQTRPVHEIALVADDTCERLVLLPLLRRVGHSAAFTRTRLVEWFSESRVAAHVLGGLAIEVPGPVNECTPSNVRTMDLRLEAQEEVDRLTLLRRVRVCAHSNRARRAARRQHHIPVARAKHARYVSSAPLTLLVTVSVHDGRGHRLEYVPLVLRVHLANVPAHPSAKQTRHLVQRLLVQIEPRIFTTVQEITDARRRRFEAVRQRAEQRLVDRDEQLRRDLRSTARELVQSGLFDRRALRAAAAREQSREILLDQLNATTLPAGDRDHRGVETSYDIRAVLIGGSL